MKELQAKIKKFCKENNLESPPEHRVLDTMSELGEVAKEILKMSDYGRKPFKYREELKSEIGDLFYSIITIANSFDIDLEDALNMIFEKYKKRLKKGSADSEND
jgi:NTP pyrophosphatase (non-canonical NTP hydrolase)